ncbi:MAG: endonuclease III [Patescibacteria group bacterium]
MPTLRRIIAVLEKLYHPPKSFLTHRSPFELLVATILSAQCTDVRVNIITERLFRKYRKPEDYISVPVAELRDDIRTCNYFNAKARYIRGAARAIIAEHGGKVPNTMEGLFSLPGVGRKTASIILHVAFGKSEGIAVDTHVFRVARRLGLSKGKTPEKVERDLMRSAPREAWGPLNPLLISFGREICTARNRRCGRCPFREDCPSSRVQGGEDLAKSDA